MANCIFARDEYQPNTGNLSHIHLMLRINKEKNDSETERQD